MKLTRALFPAATLLLAVLLPAQQAPKAPGMAPLNPRYLEYQSDLRQGKIRHLTDAGMSLGYIPPTIDLSHLSQVPFALSDTLGDAPLPRTYDLRKLGRLSPIQDQGDCGSCWTFAGMGALESALLPGELRSFSENNLKNLHGFDGSPCAGGNLSMTTAYLARWGGPVNESDDPYSTADANNSPVRTTPAKHVQDVIYIAPRANPADNDNVKRGVMAYGAAYVSIFWDNANYNSSFKSYNYMVSGSEKPKSLNHLVAVVGWDDDFDRNRFTQPAPANGAFIVRNSWGTGWGDGGYFYVSYYDATLATQSFTGLFSGIEPASNWSRIYQYDELGWVSNYGFGSATAWFANIFTAQDAESVGAVSFFVTSPGSPYSISVYSGVQGNPTSGRLLGTASGTSATAGYHTFRLDTPVSVVSGDKFSVVVRLQTPGYNYPIPLESKVDGRSSGASSRPGESWVSKDGASWSDITSSSAGANVCLKAFSNKAGSGNVNVTIATNPPNQTITVDGKQYTGSKIFSWATASSHTISADPIQAAAGTRYVFANWSDQGAQSHTIDISQAGTYTANFTTQFLLTTAASPSASGSLSASPSSTNGYYNSGAVLQLTASSATGYAFDSWSGAASGASNPLTLTMSQPQTVTGVFRSGTASIVTTNPPGLAFVVDGKAYTAPFTIDWAAGSTHTLGVASPQGTGTRYVFANWSDGGTQSHTLTVAATGRTYTANFNTQFLLTTQPAPSAGGSISATPSSPDGYYPSGAAVSLNAGARSGYSFSSWSGGLTGTTNPQSVSMSGPRTVTASFGAASAGLSNDELAGVTTIAALPYKGTEVTRGATSGSQDPGHSCTDGPDARTVWFAHTASFTGTLQVSTYGSDYDTVLSVYSGSAGKELACNDDANELTVTSLVNLVVAKGDLVVIEVSSYGPTGTGGNLALNVTGQVIAPAANDEIAAASSIASLPWTGQVMTKAATSNRTDPVHSCTDNRDGKSVWYRYVANTSGWLRVNTLGSDYDTVLSGYSGATGNELDCNDDIDDSTTKSEIEFEVRQGQAYYLQVSSYDDSAGGMLVLNAMAKEAVPSNDTYGNAFVIPSLPFSIQEDTVWATESGDDPTHSCTEDSDLRTVWFWYEAKTTGTVRINTFGSDYDTVLSIYDGETGDEIACNDDAFDDTFQSAVDLKVTAGKGYWIEVSEYNDEYATGGRMFLNVNQLSQGGGAANPASLCCELSMRTSHPEKKRPPAADRPRSR